MDWTIEFSYGMLLTSFTGSVLYLAWYIMGLWLEKAGLVRARFELLKFVIVGFFVPMAFVFLKNKGDRKEIGRGYLFAETRGLLLAGKIFTVVWAGGMLFLLLYLFRASCRLHRKTRDLFCCETEVYAQFQEIYKSLGGKGRRLRLYQSYHFTSPCMCGVLRPKVILPVHKYQREELQVIFTHEIIHYLQGAAVLKWGALFMRIFHFYNPAAWILHQEVRKWCEYACDFRACRVLGGAKRYFQVIADIAMRSSDEILAAQLVESENEVLKRMEKILKTKKSRNAKLWTKTIAAVLTGVVFMASSLSVYGATLKSADGYEYLYHLTDFGVEEKSDPCMDEHEENVEYKNTEGIVVRTGEVEELAHSISAFKWTVGGGELLQTELFACEKGDTISVNINISPENVTVKVGIILPDGSKQYIWASGDNISHRFSVSSSGNYKVFVENGTGTSVEVEGTHTWSKFRWASLDHGDSNGESPGWHMYELYCTQCDESKIIIMECDREHTGRHNTP